MPSEQITAASYTVGTASTPIVGMSADAQYVIIENQEPAANLGTLSRDGYLYGVAQRFTVAQGTSVSFGVTTGANGMRIEWYELVSETSAIEAQLVEGATVSTTGAAIAGYNLNRNVSDSFDAVFKSATSVVGGSAVSKEYLTADKHSSSGGKGASKILTLKPSADYAFKFTNLGNQDSQVFFQVVFAERYTTPNGSTGSTDVWLGGTVGDGIRLRGGERVSLPMIQGQTLNAVASNDVQIGVLRQD